MKKEAPRTAAGRVERAGKRSRNQKERLSVLKLESTEYTFDSETAIITEKDLRMQYSLFTM